MTVAPRSRVTQPASTVGQGPTPSIAGAGSAIVRQAARIRAEIASSSGSAPSSVPNTYGISDPWNAPNTLPIAS